MNPSLLHLAQKTPGGAGRRPDAGRSPLVAPAAIEPGDRLELFSPRPSPTGPNVQTCEAPA